MGWEITLKCDGCGESLGTRAGEDSERQDLCEALLATAESRHWECFESLVGDWWFCGRCQLARAAPLGRGHAAGGTSR